MTEFNHIYDNKGNYETKSLNYETKCKKKRLDKSK